MKNYEKIKINLSYRTYSLLLSDMERFLFYRGEEVNKNKFLNTLISHYYPFLQKEAKSNQEKVISTLEENNIKHAKAFLLSEQLLPYMSLKAASFLEKKKNFSLSFRPTKLTSQYLEYMEEHDLKNRSLSDYLRHLCDCYASLLPSEREYLIFYDRVKTIEDAIKEGYCIKILLDKKKVLFRPYFLTSTKEQLYMYLIGEKDKVIYSLHLYKLGDCYLSSCPSKFLKEEKEEMDKVIEKGVDYFLSEKMSIKVKFTPKGKKMLRTYWHNRPELLLEQDGIYVFEGPKLQMFNYFLQFGKEVNILYPSSFKKKLYRFYHESCVSFS